MTAESGANSNSSQSDGATSNEPSLAPVQLTPQRLQSIGVKLGTAELKQVQGELRVTGNVDVDERRIAYVQTHFPGWIRKVYADATYQYIRKGQPLFTIYSPDLVTNEQEYLLAKKNSEQVRTSTVNGVSTGENLTAGRYASSRARTCGYAGSQPQFGKGRYSKFGASRFSPTSFRRRHHSLRNFEGLAV